MQLSVTASHGDSNLCHKLNWSLEMKSEPETTPAIEEPRSLGGDSNMLSGVLSKKTHQRLRVYKVEGWKYL